MDALVASTPLQARLLLDLGNAPLLSLLMAGERSAGSLARELSQDVRRVHYRLGRLCAAGLIGVSREEKRAGRAVKYYQSLSSSYEVPFSLTDAATLRELLGAMYAPFISQFLDRLASNLEGRDARTLQITLEEGRQLSFRPRAELSDLHVGAWGIYSLTPRKAQELRARLVALSQEYSGLTEEEGARPYLLGLMFTEGELPG